MVDPLPNELVECIIDNFDCTVDRSTLLSCALVGRAWVPASQRGIFRTLVLSVPRPDTTSFDPDDYSVYTDDYIEAIARLIVIFNQKPVLASYIRCLELQNLWFAATDAMPAMPEVQRDALCTSTAEVIDRLSNVKKLSLCDVFWDVLLPSLRVALTGMFRAPSVTEVFFRQFVIHAFADLASLMSHLTQLKVLKVVEMICGDWSAPNHAGVSTGPIKLDTLILDDRAFFPWFQQGGCPLGLENLQYLQLYSSASNPRMTAFFLQQAASSLTELTLEWMGEMEDGLIHLGYMAPNLKTLELVDSFESNRISLIPWIWSLFEPRLNAEQKKYSLRQLSIFRLLCVDDFSDSYWREWATLDTLLGKPEFDALETVDIMMRSSTTPVGMYAVEMLSKNLPSLKGPEKLNIGCQIEEGKEMIIA